MKGLLVLLVVLAFAPANAQDFVRNAFATDIYGDDFVAFCQIPDEGDAVIDIYARDRHAFLQLLHRFHATDAWVYEVDWGDTDRLRVWVPGPRTTFDVDEWEWKEGEVYRSVFVTTGMTYRITGGLFRPVLWYGDEFEPLVGLGGNGAFEFSNDEVLSLDVIAAALADTETDYRVERARAAQLSLRAQNCSLQILLSAVAAIDGGLIIDRSDGVVVRSRY